MAASSTIHTHLKIHMYMVFSFTFDQLYISSTRKILETNKLVAVSSALGGHV
jgi:hypothetical protein